jgi:hypothetical protein
VNLRTRRRTHEDPILEKALVSILCDSCGLGKRYGQEALKKCTEDFLSTLVLELSDLSVPTNKSSPSQEDSWEKPYLLSSSSTLIFDFSDQHLAFCLPGKAVLRRRKSLH